tara:strand:+ start:179 stop:403 length:225 start_codon:yes stop_codon:yes gene_type:complete
MNQIILLKSFLSTIVEKDIINNEIEKNPKDLISNIKNILKKLNHEISKYKFVIACFVQKYFLIDKDIYPINKYV